MRITLVLALAVGLAAFAVGCGPTQPHEDPTVDAFVGKLTHKGQPVRFPPGDEVTLQLVYTKRAERFGIPIKSDGTFLIGWMPIGDYAAILQHTKTAAKAGQANYPVPGGLKIEAGKTDYTIELGEKYKP